MIQALELDQLHLRGGETGNWLGFGWLDPTTSQMVSGTTQHLDVATLVWRLGGFDSRSVARPFYLPSRPQNAAPGLLNSLV